MQAQDFFPQVEKLTLSEQLALLNFLVKLIQQEVVSPRDADAVQPSTLGLIGLAKTDGPTPMDAEGEVMLAERKTVLERMGGMPQHLLSVGGLSERESRRKLVAESIQARYRTQP